MPNNDGWEEVPPDDNYHPSSMETFLSSLAPKGLSSAIYGASEALPALLKGNGQEALDTYRSNRDFGRGALEKSESENPRAAMLGKTAPFLAMPALGIPGSAALGAGLSAIDSKADVTKLNDPEQLKQLARDTAIGGTVSGALGGLGIYAPKSTAAVGLGAMAGSLASPEHGALPGAALGGLAGLALNKNVAPGLREYLANTADNMANSATRLHLRPTPATKLRIGNEGMNDIAGEVRGTEAMESSNPILKFLGIGNKAEETGANLSNLQNEVGAVKGDYVNAATKPVDKSALGKEIDSHISRLGETKEGEPLANMLQEKKKGLFDKYWPGQDDSEPTVKGWFASNQNKGQGPADHLTAPAPPQAPPPQAPPVMASQIENEKMAVQNGINYNTDGSAMVGAKKDYARSLQHAAENTVDDPGFIPVKQSYGNIASAAKMANRTGALTEGGLMGKVSDVGIYGTLAHAALNGHPLTAIPLAVGRAAMKGKNASTAAVWAGRTKNMFSEGILQKVGAAMESKPALRPIYQALSKAAERGEDSFATTYYLLNKINPELKSEIGGGNSSNDGWKEVK